MNDVIHMIIFGWKFIIGLGLFFFSIIVVFGILNRIAKFIKQFWGINEG